MDELEALWEENFDWIAQTGNESDLPENWAQIRAVVQQRDAHRCQVPGCPSLLPLDVHHKIPRYQGGRHDLSNLITLCQFHHSLEEQHDLVRKEIDIPRFTYVRSYNAFRRLTRRVVKVKSHIRRYCFVTESDIRKIVSWYDFYCPVCGKQSVRATLNDDECTIVLKCLECFAGWQGKLQLAEETGPRIAELLMRKDSDPPWPPNWRALQSHASGYWKAREFCPDCGADMHLIKPKGHRRWRPFWGCNTYRRDDPTCCHGKRNIPTPSEKVLTELFG